MPKDARHLERLSHMLGADLVGTITPSLLISYLKTLPLDSPIGISVTQHGQEWCLLLNLSDLLVEPSGTEKTTTRPMSKSLEVSE